MSRSLGLESGVVRLVEYDSAWPGLFEEEAGRIRRAGTPLPIELEHVGSTSVPGMWAKPILDIAAGIGRGFALGDYIAGLARAGYDYRGESGIPGRFYFRRGEPRAYHLHMVELGGDHWTAYLAFRDYLRSHPEAAMEFSAAKRALALQFPADREAYTEAKSPLVQNILRLAFAGLSRPS